MTSTYGRDIRGAGRLDQELRGVLRMEFLSGNGGSGVVEVFI